VPSLRDLTRSGLWVGLYALLAVFPLLLLAEVGGGVGAVVRPLAWAFSWWGIALYWWAAWLYLRQTAALVRSAGPAEGTA